MTPIDPTPFVAVYVVLVFLVPWLIYGSFIVKAWFMPEAVGFLFFPRQPPRRSGRFARVMLVRRFSTAVRCVGSSSLCLCG